MRRKAPWYPSDFLDALHPQCLSTVLYIYLATVTNAITFGGLLGEATGDAQVGGEGAIWAQVYQWVDRGVFPMGAGSWAKLLVLPGGAGKFPGHGGGWSGLLPAGRPAPHHPQQHGASVGLRTPALLLQQVAPGEGTSVNPWRPGGNAGTFADFRVPNPIRWGSACCSPRPLYRDYGLDYLPFRLWVGIWVATFCLALVATEASVLVRYFTRFTEEGFCILISLIFIYDAVGKMLSLAQAYPIQISGSLAYGCLCQWPEPGGG